MKRELAIALLIIFSFGIIAAFTDAPAWVALIVSLIAGMWADLRMRR